MSTPLRQRISNNIETNLSPLRRSLVTSTPITTYNDDETERNRRRSRAEVVRTVSRGSISITDGSDDVNDHFQMCLQLFAENKINAKNVWNLRIIDYMRTTLQRKGDLGDMLKLASASLDASAKIYALRVDDVYNEMMKLAESVARIGAQGKKNDMSGDAEADSDADDNADGDKNQRQAGKARKKRKTNAYIATDESLNAPVPRADSVNAAKLLRRDEHDTPLNMSLLTPYGGYDLLVPSRANTLEWQAETTSAQSQPVKYHITLSSTVAIICPSFADFVANECVDQGQADLSRHSMHTFTEEVVYDAAGFPIAELDPVPENDPASDGESNGENPGAVNVETIHITEMRPDAQAGLNLEYSYRRPVPVISERFGITGAWAGPAHWKLKCLRKPRSSTVSTEKQAPARISRPVVPLDLLGERPPIPPPAASLRETTRRLKVPTDRYSRHLLPEDVGISKQIVEALLTKPSHRVQHLIPRPSNKVATVDNNSQPFNTSLVYDYNNQEDVQYCRRISDQGRDMDNADVDDVPDAYDNELGRTIADYDMANAPNIVPQSTVAYATRAKKIDMKGLKAAMWNQISKNYDKPEGVLFSTLYETLPIVLPSRTAADMSLPLAFVSLLHLANEHTLMLCGTPKHSNITVHKG